MPRPRAVWINTVALARTLDLAKQAGADEGDLLGAQRALDAGQGPDWRFTMLVKSGFAAVWDTLFTDPRIRHRLYTVRVFGHLLAKVDDNGLYVCEADELAEDTGIPRAAIYTVLVDLERVAGAITRLRKGRHLRGIELTPKLHRRPALKIRRPSRNGRDTAAPVVPS